MKLLMKIHQAATQHLRCEGRCVARQIRVLFDSGGERSATPVNGQNYSVSIDSCQVLRFVQKGGTCKHSIMKPDCASVGDHASSKMFVAEINNTSDCKEYEC
jgi:hypothetical protein